MKIRYLCGKPNPKDPMMLALIAAEGISYDNELVGDDIWAEPEVDDGEEFESPFGCLWPACQFAGFESITDEHLNNPGKLKLSSLLESMTLGDLKKDLARLDHVFLHYKRASD